MNSVPSILDGMSSQNGRTIIKRRLKTVAYSLVKYTLLGIPIALLVIRSQQMIAPITPKHEQKAQPEDLKNSHRVIRSEPWNHRNTSMEDPNLIAAIRKRLHPPSTLPYNFLNKNYYRREANPSWGQVQAVKDILKGFGRDGFFVECGANNGEWHSNTIWLEKYLGWSGLLFEADPTVAKRLFSKNRKAWTGEFCASDEPYPKTADFYIQKGKGYHEHLGSGLIQSLNYKALASVQVQCFPLYSILLAVNRTTVDFLSLDVEGNELDVLRTIPFEKVTFKVITVEHLILKEGKLGLRQFMESNGYIFYRTVVDAKRYTAGDSIFIHNSVRLTKPQRANIGIEDSDVTRMPR